MNLSIAQSPAVYQIDIDYALDGADCTIDLYDGNGENQSPLDDSTNCAHYAMG